MESSSGGGTRLLSGAVAAPRRSMPDFWYAG
eukprot:CAMPEP_0172399258 /NCGR_PEP_ID=MMETSP1061-20121228/40122_1 /TAXON_ID=37318 /ORGANISM="Pseudo-nitzschia pungens, Strain cf. pungens" /LENGTH=30 /DNA_ID= /DNA_START= /DNA_END= /DNA_ORIENTATION=